ncbi:MAG: nucleotidyltransferase domain-containing protein [Nanoarchaeota archaeon]
MSQINYSIKIVESLLKRENHVRGLAKELGTNQTTIARKLKELYKENAVDFRFEGKNKVFSLKKSLEAKQYCCIMEQFSLLYSIKKHPELRIIAQKISENEKIGLAILFGSYAKNTAAKDSDIDIYIDTTSTAIKDEVELINSKINVKIGKYDKNSLLIREIEKGHIILKGTEQYYERASLFA